MKFKFDIFGRRVSLRTHEPKQDIFQGRHWHWFGRLQNWLWHRGVSVHNFVIDECTQDFSCCCWPGDKFASFAEQLVAVAKGVEDGRHDGVMFIKKPPTDE